MTTQQLAIALRSLIVGFSLILLLQLRAIEHSLSVIANKKTVISMPETSVFLLSENEPKALLPKPKWNGREVKVR